jgi:hypothetical protein
MQNKRILVLLLVVLLISGTLLIVFMLNQKKTSTTQLPSVPAIPTPKTTPVKEDLSLEDVNKLLNAESEITEEEFEEIKKQPVTTAMGKITSKENNQITVELTHLENTWSSKVSINQDSTIYLPAPDANSMGEAVDLDQLKVGDQIVVNSEETILNKPTFTALSVHKIQ